MPKAVRGVLIECEPAIKSIIVHEDAKNNDYIIEDLDETHLVIKENMVQILKQKLDERLKESIAPKKKIDSDDEEF